MEQFYRTHNELLESVNSPIKRELKNEINWQNRLIGIKGTRGIGKTHFLLDYIKSNFGHDKSCLYANLNNFYFSHNTLVDFADEFRKTGGRILVLDQVFKYPDWSASLGQIYDRFPDLNVIFTGSPVMRLKDDNPHLKGKVSAYQLRGLSFREYLNYKTGSNFAKYSLEDLLKYHAEIAKDILFKVKPLAHFGEYLKFGFYPFFIDKNNFGEHLIKVANLTLEIDIPYLQQMEIKYLPKLKKLLFTLAEDMPHVPNVSQLSSSIETSRATVVNYFKYLRNARLINMVYSGDVDYSKKPDRLYFQNTNLLQAISMSKPSQSALSETFFLNQLNYENAVSSNGKVGEFVIENDITIKIGNNKRLGQNPEKVFIATDMDEVGEGKRIPLWLFGFLG